MGNFPRKQTVVVHSIPPTETGTSSTTKTRTLSGKNESKDGPAEWDVWECSKCTFVNPINNLTCVMCYQVRTQTKDLVTIWEWQADEKWIPYDLSAATQIEAAYQAGEPDCLLDQGWFAMQRSRYAVSFGAHRAPTTTSSALASKLSSAANSGMCQVNLQSGVVRLIRRLGDDDTFLKPVDVSLLKASDTCSICLVSFLPERSSESDAEAATSRTTSQALASDGQSITHQPASTQPVESESTSVAQSAEALPVTTQSVPFDTLATADRTGTRDINSLADIRVATLTSDLPSVAAESTVSHGAVDAKCIRSAECSDNVQRVGGLGADVVVKLPKCTNHYFHRACIGQWIKLNDKCPLCSAKLM